MAKAGLTFRGMVHAVAVGLVLALLYGLSRWNYLVFHSLVELFSVAVAATVFLVFWNSQRFLKSGYFMVLGTAYLYVALIDLLHALAYEGMGVFGTGGSNLATQLWIAGRYVESAALLAAALFLGRRLRSGALLIGWGVLTAGLLLAIFHWQVFPTCFDDAGGGKGHLTTFKTVSEYAVCAVLLVAIAALLGRPSELHSRVLALLVASMGVTIASELSFTLYSDVFGIANMAGHLLKLVSFYLIYKALVELSLREPYDLLFKNLKDREQTLQETLGTSEQRQLEVGALLEAARAVLDGREFASAARGIFDACKRATGATAGYVALLSADGAYNEVLFLDAGGRECAVDPDLPMPVRGLRAESYRSGKVVYDNEFANSRWMTSMPAGHARLDNVMFAPLVIDGRPVGLIGLANKPGGFTANDTRLAAAFGELAAVALRNTQTVESLQHSEERFRAVAETATDAVISVDGRGQVVFWNRAAEAIFGWSAEEMSGRTLTTVMPERFRAGHEEGMQRLVAGEAPRLIGCMIELYGLRKDGTEFPLELSLARWRTTEGTFFTGIVRDVTQRRQAQADRERVLGQLATEQARLRAIIESAPEGIVVTDREGKVIMMNPAAEELYEHQSPYDVDQTDPACPRLCDADGRVYSWQDRPLTLAALEGQTHANLEVALVWPDGRRRDLLQNTAPIHDAEGRITGAVGVFQDISTQHAFRAELARRAEQLETLIREAHHRIRNNLQSVIALLELERGQFGPAGEASLDRCVSRIRAIATVHRLLTTQATSEVPLQSLLEGLAELAGAAGAGREQVSVDIGVSGLNVRVDSRTATNLAVVVNELIANAMEHAFAGRPSGRIHVTVAEANDGMVEIAVTDNGRGCATQVQEGTGLLLARNIVERDLGGTFEMDSGPPGCRCLITFRKGGRHE